MKETYKLSLKRKREIIRKTSMFLLARDNISFAYIFGSFGEKGNLPFRDIDIAIYLEPLTLKQNKAFDYETNLALELSRLIKLPADKIDIKILNFTPSSFQSNVFATGLLLFFRNEKLLTELIEKKSFESISNYEFIKESLLELV